MLCGPHASALRSSITPLLRSVFHVFWLRVIPDCFPVHVCDMLGYLARSMPLMRPRFRAWRTGTRECRRVVMSIVDLTKATVMCGGVAFLIYRLPTLAKALLIGFLGLLWLA